MQLATSVVSGGHEAYAAVFLPPCMLSSQRLIDLDENLLCNLRIVPFARESHRRALHLYSACVFLLFLALTLSETLLCPLPSTLLYNIFLLRHCSIYFNPSILLLIVNCLGLEAKAWVSANAAVREIASWECMASWDAHG